MQLDRLASFISLIIMGHFWLVLLKCPRYPLLYWKWKGESKGGKGSHLVLDSHLIFCEASSSPDACFINPFACSFTSWHRHTV